MPQNVYGDCPARSLINECPISERSVQTDQDAVQTILEGGACLGLDPHFQRLWRFYLAYCEAGFRERHCTLHQIVLAGRDRPASTSVDPVSG